LSAPEIPGSGRQAAAGTRPFSAQDSIEASQGVDGPSHFLSSANGRFVSNGIVSGGQDGSRPAAGVRQIPRRRRDCPSRHTPWRVAASGLADVMKQDERGTPTPHDMAEVGSQARARRPLSLFSALRSSPASVSVTRAGTCRSKSKGASKTLDMMAAVEAHLTHQSAPHYSPGRESWGGEQQRDGTRGARKGTGPCLRSSLLDRTRLPAEKWTSPRTVNGYPTWCPGHHETEYRAPELEDRIAGNCRTAPSAARNKGSPGNRVSRASLQ
jgi:hypothetical protein